eukprot:c28003_g1_i2 orf=831-2183(+)
MVKQEPDIELVGGQGESLSSAVVSRERCHIPGAQSTCLALRETRDDVKGFTFDRTVPDNTPISHRMQSEEPNNRISLFRGTDNAIGEARSKDCISDSSAAQKVGSVASEVGVKELGIMVKNGGAENQQRALPSVGTFTVQCAVCFKWRLIPTKELYEEIRQCILEKPWVCQYASSWRLNASCAEPTDLSQDMTRLWAIDKPNIPLAPPGWERLMVIRGEGSSKFADIYYREPSGKRLRSMPEVERFLAEHPEYMEAGININQFSFMTPRPLDKHYMKKKPGTKTVNVGSNESSMKASRHLFKPGSSKVRAEKAIARRRTLAEILAGGQCQASRPGSQHTFMNDLVPPSVQTNQQVTGIRMDLASQVELPNSGHLALTGGHASEFLAISEHPSCRLNQAFHSSESVNQPAAERIGIQSSRSEQQFNHDLVSNDPVSCISVVTTDISSPKNV